MKLFSILSHPLTLIFCFSIILISGESWGGPYLEYVLLGLHGHVLHSYLALAGIAVVFLSYAKYKAGGYPISLILNVLGLGLMLYALMVFFIRSHGYNAATFHQFIPVASIILFGLVALLFLVRSVRAFTRASSAPPY